MNTFALGSILIILLILPGIIFRLAYLKGPYSKQNFQVSAIDEVIWAIIPTLVLQFIGCVVVELFFSIDIDLIIRLLTGYDYKNLDFKKLKTSIPLFVGYMLSLYVFSLLIGWLFRWLVFKIGLDRRYNFFRFNNEWFYLFSEIDFPIELIQIDALVKGESNSYIIYSGILEDIFLSKIEGLDRIHLHTVFRRNFEKDLDQLQPLETAELSTNTDRYYKMPGDIFIIPYSQIVNLNISYYELKKQEVFKI